MNNNVASRKQPDFRDMEPYYNLSFMCMNPRNQLKYFYINRFAAVTKEEHLKYHWLYADETYNFEIINPIYQLFISISERSVRMFDFFPDVPDEIDFSTFEDPEDLYYDLLGDGDFFEEFEKKIEIHTTIEDFLNGKEWKELRRRCRVFLKKINLPIWQKFEQPIQFSAFLYPINFEVYAPFPYWSYYKVYDKETWRILKRKYELLYKDAHFNF